jgi:hypothetical protein
VVESAVDALLQRHCGLARLSSLFLGQNLRRLLQELGGGRLRLLDAYRLLLEGVAEGLGLPASIFSRAALAQPDATWPESSSTVVLVRGHCDLRDQSLSRRGGIKVRAE